jgi:hypothetical protein
LRPWHLGIRARAFIDVDPVFTQIRHLTDPATAALIEAHTSHFTFGVLIAAGAADVPDDGVQWQATRQPIVLDVWPQSRGEPEGRFTTAMVWESYDTLDFAGLSYGMKSTSFTPYMDLPLHVRCELELAVGGHSVPRDELTAGGWRLVDPLPVTSELTAYQQYIRGSKAEFSVAKHGYVAGMSGWFSERSAAYLATGRPVVVQDTGFSEWLKAGEGVIAFRSPAESVEGIHDVNRNYSRHCRAAREIAETVFDSATVLPELLERIK